jgi:ferritin-like metal-binding protein YciE
VARLERVFEMLDKSPRGKRCAGIIGLIDEGSELLREDGHSAALDAGLILAGQKVEHYEIAAYGTLASYAEILDMQDALPLLKQTLAEEKHADETLSQLAMSINSAAEMSQPHAE